MVQQMEKAMGHMQQDHKEAISLLSTKLVGVQQDYAAVLMERDHLAQEASMLAEDWKGSPQEDGSIEPPQTEFAKQRWEFLFAQANGDRLVLSERLATVERELFEVADREKQLLENKAADDAAFLEMRAERDKLRLDLEKALTRLSIDEEHTLRNRLAYMHTERCELLARLSEMEHGKEEAIVAGTKACTERSEAARMCEESNNRAIQLEQILREAKGEWGGEIATAKKFEEASAKEILALKDRAEAAEEFSAKLQNEVVMLQLQAGEGPQSNSIAEKLQRNNNFLVKRVASLQEHVKRSNGDLVRQEAIARTAASEALLETRDQLLNGLQMRIDMVMARGKIEQGEESGTLDRKRTLYEVLEFVKEGFEEGQEAYEVALPAIPDIKNLGLGAATATMLQVLDVGGSRRSWALRSRRVCSEPIETLVGSVSESDSIKNGSKSLSQQDHLIEVHTNNNLSTDLKEEDSRFREGSTDRSQSNSASKSLPPEDPRAWVTTAISQEPAVEKGQGGNKPNHKEAETAADFFASLASQEIPSHKAEGTLTTDTLTTEPVSSASLNVNELDEARKRDAERRHRAKIITPKVSTMAQEGSWDEAPVLAAPAMVLVSGNKKKTKKSSGKKKKAAAVVANIAEIAD